MNCDILKIKDITGQFSSIVLKFQFLLFSLHFLSPFLFLVDSSFILFKGDNSLTLFIAIIDPFLPSFIVFLVSITDFVWFYLANLDLDLLLFFPLKAFFDPLKHGYRFSLLSIASWMSLSFSSSIRFICLSISFW